MIPFRKSLAFRILFIFFILLCLPVLVDSFVLLNQSFKEGEESAKKFIMESSTLRQLPLSELVPSNSPIVKLLENELNLKENFPQEPSDELNEELAKLATHGDFSTIMLLKHTKDNRFTIVGSSMKTDVGSDVTKYIDIIHTDPTGFSLIYILGDRKYHFLNAYSIYSKQHELLGALLVYTDISQKLNSLIVPDLTRYPIFFSILLDNSIIYVGTDPALDMNYFVALSPEDQELFLQRLIYIQKQGIKTNELASSPIPIKNAIDFPFFTFIWKGKEMLGYVSQIGKSRYYLLSYVIKKDIFSEVWANFIYIYGTYALILLLGSILAFLITKRFTRPLDRLIDTMKQIQLGKNNVRALLDPLGFEVNVLGSTFNEMIDNLLEKEKLAETEKLKWELYLKELHLGEEVQRKLFVEQKIVPEGIEVETHYLPALEVGGDFCDLFMHKGKLVLMIADAAGKGVEACFYSLIVRSLMRIFSQELNDTAIVVKKTNHLFLQDVDESGIFVTVLLAFYDPETRNLSYYNGGHNPAILRRKNGTLEFLKKNGAALGIDIGVNITGCAHIVLQPGDQVIFYTDGITEAHNPSKELFSESRLMKVIVEEGDKSAAHLSQAILDAVRNFENNEMQHDDITLMVMKVKDV